MRQQEGKMPVPSQTHKKGRSRGKCKTDRSQSHISNVRGSATGSQPKKRQVTRPAGTPIEGKQGRASRQKEN